MSRALPNSWSRQLSANELSYYLPSRDDGTNDVYFSAEFFAPPTLITSERIFIAWTILRLRHALLSARVELDASLCPSDTDKNQKERATTTRSALEAYYRSAQFIVDAPRSAADALDRTQASGSLDLRSLNHDAEEAEKSSAALVQAFLNGPRFLSSNRLAGLVVARSPRFEDPALQPIDALGSSNSPSTPMPSVSDDNEGSRRTKPSEQELDEPERKYTVLIATAHCAISGLPVLLLIDELFELLGGSRADGAARYDEARSTQELQELLELEYSKVHRPDGDANTFEGPTSSARVESSGAIPPSLEQRIEESLKTGGTLADDVERDFEKEKKHWIGAHTFPRKAKHSTSLPPSPFATGQSGRDNRFIDMIWPPALLPQILRRCKERGGVTVQNALFAACNLAWLRVARNRERGTRSSTSAEEEGSTLMYSAMNVRPFLPSLPSPADAVVNDHHSGTEVEEDYAFLGIGYFNVMLPGTPSSPNSAPDLQRQGDFDAEEAAFWECARSAKTQAETAVKHPDLLARTVLACEDRSRRAVEFAILDDGWADLLEEEVGADRKSVASTMSSTQAQKKPGQGSAALLGLSLLGRLDGHLHTSSYPRLRPTLLRTGARKAANRGGVLLMSWSFGGVLDVSLCWDAMALEEGVVEGFVKELRSVLGTFVVGEENAEGIDATDFDRAVEHEREA